MLGLSSKWATVFKYLLAILFGVTVRSFFDMSTARTDVLDVKPCICDVRISKDDLFESDANLQLRESFLPLYSHEVINYDYFNSSIVADSSSCGQIMPLRRIDKIEITEIVSQTAALISSQRKSRWKVSNLHNGYRRLDPARGMEYVIDVDIVPAEKSTAERHRIQLIRPFGFMRILTDGTVDEERMINFIIAVPGATAEYYRFLANFEDVFMQNEQHCYLLIVACVNVTAEANRVRSAGDLLQRRHWRKLHVRVVHLKRAFSPALALDIGLRQLPNSALVMLLDIDIQFSSATLHRCRLVAIEGQQIYYPVPFVQYMPYVVNQFSPQNEVQEFGGLNRHTGEKVL